MKGWETWQRPGLIVWTDYPDNEAEEAAYAYLERIHAWGPCGWTEHFPECQRLCEAYGFEGWEHWKGTRREHH